MKFFFLYLIVLCASGCWFISYANAEYRSGNSHYQTIHVRQMAQRNFSNNGRSKYVYMEQNDDSVYSNVIKVGGIKLEKNSRIRELSVAVDMKRSNRMRPWHREKKISIGNVSGGGKYLKNVNVIVHSNRQLGF